MESLIELSQKDLNLLTVFAAINQTRQVTKAARLLAMSQPAASHALTRLRDLFNDQLFVKTPKGVTPTPLAIDLAPKINSLLNFMSSDVFAAKAFDCQNLKRSFHLKTTDFIEALLLPRILDSFAVQAPEVKIKTTTPGFDLPKIELEQGEADLAIAGFFGKMPLGFYRQKLFEDEFVCCVRKNHPRLGHRKKSSITKHEYIKERHVLIAPNGILSSKVDKILGTTSRRSIQAGLSNFMSSGWVVSQSETILTGPKRLIGLLENVFALKVMKLPIAVPRISIVQVWHERNNQDAAHKWFRDQVRDALQE